VDGQPVERKTHMIKKVIGHFQERTGIYSLGFDPASFAGIALPVAFVVVVGGALIFFLVM
jgi:hypothetical protein